MKTYALFSIGRRHERLLAVVKAETVTDAARELGGTAVAVRKVGQNDRRYHTFDLGRETAEFIPEGSLTAAKLAGSAPPELMNERGVATLAKQYQDALTSAPLVLGEVASIR